MDIKILYEDNHLLIVKKPVNIPVQEDKSRDDDLLSILKKDIKVRYNKPGNVFLALVHRLDRPVGGAIVFAKTSKGASRLADILRRRKLDREYFAIVRGHVRKKEGKLIHYLKKDNKNNKVYSVNQNERDAKKAILNYDVVGHYNRDYTLLRIKLETGRSHQIRVQLSEIGHPLYGDQKYGAHVNKPGEQIALWSTKLSFKHPTKDEIITVSSYPPSEYPWDLFTFN